MARAFRPPRASQLPSGHALKPIKINRNPLSDSQNPLPGPQTFYLVAKSSAQGCKSSVWQLEAFWATNPLSDNQSNACVAQQSSAWGTNPLSGSQKSLRPGHKSLVMHYISFVQCIKPLSGSHKSLCLGNDSCTTQQQMILCPGQQSCVYENQLFLCPNKYCRM